jgi:hypothetical protein
LPGGAAAHFSTKRELAVNEILKMLNVLIAGLEQLERRLRHEASRAETARWVAVVDEILDHVGRGLDEATLTWREARLQLLAAREILGKHSRLDGSRDLIALIGQVAGTSLELITASHQLRATRRVRRERAP